MLISGSCEDRSTDRWDWVKGLNNITFLPQQSEKRWTEVRCVIEQRGASTNKVNPLQNVNQHNAFSPSSSHLKALNNGVAMPLNRLRIGVHTLAQRVQRNVAGERRATTDTQLISKGLSFHDTTPMCNATKARKKRRGKCVSLPDVVVPVLQEAAEQVDREHPQPILRLY